ncbi:uncharacterized protein KY384_004012 [Bacidia gigantensis]|uniref:uncharacterized protein n=1 Tax=Bacidia gigantensis TaxID=2732470 RepID=UPI001D036AB7|nr:uncharacterized protein KY384_004012 [Bacidia gigantensis]KAG8530657.1 hypothetical protein KY384_004012 [Bacidia gigantensis]
MTKCPFCCQAHNWYEQCSCSYGQPSDKANRTEVMKPASLDRVKQLSPSHVPYPEFQQINALSTESNPALTPHDDGNNEALMQESVSYISQPSRYRLSSNPSNTSLEIMGNPNVASVIGKAERRTRRTTSKITKAMKNLGRRTTPSQATTAKTTFAPNAGWSRFEQPMPVEKFYGLEICAQYHAHYIGYL